MYEMRNRKQQVVFSRYYYWVSAAYVLLGGYTAFVFPGATTEFGAMIIGVGLVCVVNTMSKVAGRLVRRYVLSQSIERELEKHGGKGGLRDPFEFRRATEPRSGRFWDYIDLI